MSLIRSPAAIGLFTGLALPPLVSKLFLQPLLVQAKYDEIDSIKLDLDHLGWQLRILEETSGLKEEDVYIPTSYFQGRY